MIYNCSGPEGPQMSVGTPALKLREVRLLEEGHRFETPTKKYFPEGKARIPEDANSN